MNFATCDFRFRCPPVPISVACLQLAHSIRRNNHTCIQIQITNHYYVQYIIIHKQCICNSIRVQTAFLDLPTGDAKVNDASSEAQLSQILHQLQLHIFKANLFGSRKWKSDEFQWTAACGSDCCSLFCCLWFCY